MLQHTEYDQFNDEDLHEFLHIMLQEMQLSWNRQLVQADNTLIFSNDKPTQFMQ